MENSSLQSPWNDPVGSQKTGKELRSMMREGKHPVLKRIRKQLVIEILAFSAFLLVYYDFFDGHTKPLYANLLLVTAIVLLILYSVFGYILTKQPVAGVNLKQSLNDHLRKMRTYAMVSVAIRSLALVCLLLFFSSTITFNSGKLWLLAGLIIVAAVQMFLLLKMWKGKIWRMREIIADL